MADAPIVILARAGNLPARALAAAWPDGGAQLLTPGDVLRAAWRWRLRPSGAITMAGPDYFTAPAGVLCLLEAVTVVDLPGIAPADRAYAAAELNAFLLAWLYNLPCRRLNPPSLTALNGERHMLAWRAHAREAGLALLPLEAADPEAACTPPPGPAMAVTAIAGSIIGGNARAQQAVRRLAQSARLPMLQACLCETPHGLALHSASAQPDLASAAAAAALVKAFQS